MRGQPTQQKGAGNAGAHHVTATALVTPSVEDAVQQFSRLIHREAHTCLRMLPRSTMYTHDDLYNEGVIELIITVTKRYDPSRGYKVITLLLPNLRHRFGELVRMEWRKCGKLPRPQADPDVVLGKLPVPPPQEALADRLEALQGLGGRPALPVRRQGRPLRWPDRYAALRTPRMALPAHLRPALPPGPRPSG